MKEGTRNSAMVYTGVVISENWHVFRFILKRVSTLYTLFTCPFPSRIRLKSPRSCEERIFNFAADGKIRYAQVFRHLGMKRVNTQAYVQSCEL
jgi:hypothetical protein